MAKRTRKQVDAAVVQQAMAELGITVPVRAWKIEDKRLVLLLATEAQLVWEGKVRGLSGRKGRQDAGAPQKGGQDARAPRGGQEKGGQDARAPRGGQDARGPKRTEVGDGDVG